MKVKDTLTHRLWAERMARDFVDFPKSSKEWNTFKVMEDAFLHNFPEHRERYEVHMKEASKTWGDNFAGTFKTRFLWLYLTDNFDVPTTEMV